MGLLPSHADSTRPFHSGPFAALSIVPQTPGPPNIGFQRRTAPATLPMPARRSCHQAIRLLPRPKEAFPLQRKYHPTSGGGDVH